MAGSINKVLIVGNVGNPPELRFLQSGQAVLNFSVATNEGYKTANGEWLDKTEWHRIVVWGEQGQRLNDRVQKGTLVGIDGKMQTRSWEDREGSKRYTTEIIARHVTVLARDGKKAESEETPPLPTTTATPYGGNNGTDTFPQDFSDDDIPF